MTVRYLTKDELIAINQYFIKQTGKGSAVVVDQDGLSSIVEQPQMVSYGHEVYQQFGLRQRAYCKNSQRAGFLQTVILERPISVL